MTGRGHDTRGSALGLTVVIMLLLELLAHGALLLAQREEVAARAGAALLEGRAASAAGLAAGEGAPPPRASMDVGLWESLSLGSGVVGAGRYDLGMRRLSAEFWLLEAEGHVGRRPWSVPSTTLAWLAHPVARLGAFDAVVEVGQGTPVSGVDRIDASAVRTDPVGWDPLPCRPWRTSLDSLYRGRSMPPVAARPMPQDGEPSLGLLDPPTLLAWAPPGVPQAPWGSGAIGGDLLVEDTALRGTLIVHGDLDLTRSRMEGLALVGGRLRLRDGSTLVGMARAAGGIDVDGTSEIVGSGCRVLVALEAAASEWLRPLTRPSWRVDPS